MAVIPIDSLTEVQSAGENDMLLLSTSNGAKKIKASAVGGSGDLLITFSTQDFKTFTSDKTMRQIAQAIRDGKRISGILDSGDSVYVFNLSMYHLIPDADWETADKGTCNVHLLCAAWSEGGSISGIQLNGYYETVSGAHQFQDYWTLDAPSP